MTNETTEAYSPSEETFNRRRQAIGLIPISTPPNAIVYSSGYIPLRAMVRNGLVLDIVGYFIVVAGVLLLSGLLYAHDGGADVQPGDRRLGTGDQEIKRLVSPRRYTETHKDLAFRRGHRQALCG